MQRRTLLSLLAAAPGWAQKEKPKGEILAQYYPTPKAVVRKMLRMADLRPGEKLYDIGSGDGRIVIMGVQDFQAVGVGVELDESLVKQSLDAIRRLGIGDKARIIHGDALVQDYSDADVITVYLLPEFNAKLRPILEKQLRKGTRVVCHDFYMDKWAEDEFAAMDDDEGRRHNLYLYRR